MRVYFAAAARDMPGWAAPQSSEDQRKLFEFSLARSARALVRRVQAKDVGRPSGQIIQNGADQDLANRFFYMSRMTRPARKQHPVDPA